MLISGHSNFAAAKSAFLSARTKATTKIIVRRHCIVDHPTRKFTEREILELVKAEDGKVIKNEMNTAIPGSILFKCKDADGDECE